MSEQAPSDSLSLIISYFFPRYNLKIQLERDPVGETARGPCISALLQVIFFQARCALTSLFLSCGPSSSAIRILHKSPGINGITPAANAPANGIFA